jgi:membrane-associated phospholipid phosphatase
MIARPPAVVPVGAALAFLILGVLAVGARAPLRGVDVTMSEALRGYGTANPETVAAAEVLTGIGALTTLVTGGLVAAAILAGLGQREPAVFCAVVTGLVPALWGAMHHALSRPRPVDGFIEVASSGFPSGHTANSSAAGLVVLLLLWPALGVRGRIITTVLVIVVALVVGVTRVVLLAHWPTDVLGGWLLALAVVPAVARLAALVPVTRGGPARRGGTA